MDQRICQSCAMPMPTDDLLGTDSNGGLQQDYCKYCYGEGRFFKEETMEQMIDSCVPLMLEGNTAVTEEQVRAHMRGLLPTLKRWK